MFVSVKLSLGKSSQICITISQHIPARLVNILLISSDGEGEGSWSIISMEESFS